MRAGRETGSVTAGSSGDVVGAAGVALPDPVGVGEGVDAGTVGDADADGESTFGASAPGADDVDEQPRSVLARATATTMGTRR
jgi:hypothetical protein